ncbi:hypothetical protein [Clostridium sp. AM58-1XD]|uniref:hypothetical protein n=1 Tax=Clostridium sp. AM58-1XD TaxID=2292307 RepID=UPI000E46FBC3|nr:hypothetical protein [Clostridium sp. AM58-1XD]RGZ00602.1 hypothetical protein DXA13_03920 [Clostridium sp. AM58-1XD]
MSHSLHRRGNPEDLRQDYIILVTSAKGINNDGAIPYVADILDMLWNLGPSNIGSNETGTILSGVTKEQIRENLTSIPRIRCNYFSKEKVWQAVKELQKKDYGLSVVLQGTIEDIEKECREIGIKPHSVNLSIDIWGKREKLPSEEVLEFVTMCGHGLISASLVEYVINRVKDGRMTPEQGVVKMGEPCVCGFFNPERALKLLKNMVPDNDNKRHSMDEE